MFYVACDNWVKWFWAYVWAFRFKLEKLIPFILPSLVKNP